MCKNSTNFHTSFVDFTHHCENLHTLRRVFSLPLRPKSIHSRMTLTDFFIDSPLWVSIPIALGYLAVAIIFVVLLVRLFRLNH